MNRRTILWASALVCLFALSAVADETYQATTTADPKVPVADLNHLLKPKLKSELVSEADAWIGLLKGKVEEIGAAEIAVAKKEGGENLSDLRKERDGLIKRVNAVIAALTEKTPEDDGDGAKVIAVYEAYVTAVAGKAMEQIDVKDPSKILTTVVAWLKSPDGGLLWAKNIISFIVIIILFKILASILGKLVGKAVARWKNASELLKDFFVNTIKKVTFFIGLIVALGMLGINIGPFVAAIGAVGFIIGFALQGTLSNFASGIMILLYRPYDIGEIVNVAGVTGKVNAMSLVSTTIKTPDNQIVVVPNSSIWGDVITNITGSDTRRVDLVVGIGYSDDIAKAQGILESILASHPKVLEDPEPVIKVHELADSSVNFVVRPWAKTSDYWDVYWDVTRAVKERFDEENVSILFPQRDVHMI